MIKAVFMDYTGTIVQDNSKEMQEVVMRVCRNSDLHDPGAVVALWRKLVKQYEESSFEESYLSEDEIVDRVLDKLTEEINLHEKLGELHELIRSFWVNAPLFPDVRGFLESSPVPVYVISNNSMEYVEKGMEIKGLVPAGIICADMARIYKPHKELFEKALEVSACKADEVIHVGDSYGSDVQGALLAGIRPVLLQRTGEAIYTGITLVRSLSEVISFVQ